MLCGARPYRHCISIHAPRMGSDGGAVSALGGAVIFQSTLPGWGATGRATAVHGELELISIHAPRMGSDLAYPKVRTIIFDISIHAPRMGSDYSGRGLMIL